MNSETSYGWGFSPTKDAEGIAQTWSWWDKTVEHSYLTSLAKGLTIAPFEGHTAQGGLMFEGEQYAWRLIEFKTSAHSFATELSKYPESAGQPNRFVLMLLHDLAQRREVNVPEPHFFVYATGISNGKMRLSARRYWGAWFKKSMFGLAEYPEQDLDVYPILHGVPQIEFDAYIRKLIAARTNGARVAHLETGTSDCVLGISRRGTQMISMSLADYVYTRQLRPL